MTTTTDVRVDPARVLALELPILEYAVERGAVRAYARVVGETDPVHLDVAAARAAGHSDLLVPPAFLYGADRERPFPMGYLEELGIEAGQVLHGEQSFTYHRDVHAGDVLRVVRRVVDAYPKGPAMTFVCATTELYCGPELVVTLEQLVIVREVAA